MVHLLIKPGTKQGGIKVRYGWLVLLFFLVFPGCGDQESDQPYPGWVYAMGKNMDKNKVGKIKQALLELDFNHESHRDILKAANFIKVIGSSDSDFDSVRQLAAKVGMSL